MVRPCAWTGYGCRGTGPAARGEFDIQEWSDGPLFPDPDLYYWLCDQIPTDENPVGENWFYICDSEFNLPIEHAKEVCRAIIDASFIALLLSVRISVVVYLYIKTKFEGKCHVDNVDCISFADLRGQELDPRREAVQRIVRSVVSADDPGDVRSVSPLIEVEEDRGASGAIRSRATVK
jgi:hypothetical protein